MKKLICIICINLLLSGFLHSQSDFRNVRWGMSKNEVTARENLDQYSEPTIDYGIDYIDPLQKRKPTSRITRGDNSISIRDVWVGNYNADVTFYFYKGALYSTKYTFDYMPNLLPDILRTLRSKYQEIETGPRTVKLSELFKPPDLTKKFEPYLFKNERTIITVSCRNCYYYNGVQSGCLSIDYSSIYHERYFERIRQERRDKLDDDL
jgi:hypothetical protein